MPNNTLKIGYGKTPNILLLGNGINRAYGFASWDDLIRSVQTKELSEKEAASLKDVPYPLQPVILTGDHLGIQMEGISRQLSELEAPEEEKSVLKNFVSVSFDAILTTNYTYELEKALDPSFVCLPDRQCKVRMTAYDDAGKYNTEQLHTYFQVEDSPSIWHIHGEAARHGTMIFEHYYYGKLLSKMQQYVSSLVARHKVSLEKQEDLEARSWIDWFMLGNVHIAGSGMSLSEMDLWWLINCKNCQVAQTNWAISPLKEIDTYESEINAYIDYFVDALKKGVSSGVIAPEDMGLTKEACDEMYDEFCKDNQEMSYMHFCEQLYSQHL